MTAKPRVLTRKRDRPLTWAARRPPSRSVLSDRPGQHKFYRVSAGKQIFASDWNFRRLSAFAGLAHGTMARAGARGNGGNEPGAAYSQSPIIRVGDGLPVGSLVSADRSRCAARQGVALLALCNARQNSTILSP